MGNQTTRLAFPIAAHSDADMLARLALMHDSSWWALSLEATSNVLHQINRSLSTWLNETDTPKLLDWIDETRLDVPTTKELST